MALLYGIDKILKSNGRQDVLINAYTKAKPNTDLRAFSGMLDKRGKHKYKANRGIKNQ